MKKSGVCVIPGSSEDQALSLVGRIRRILPEERTYEVVSQRIPERRHVIETAIEFANAADLPFRRGVFANTAVVGVVVFAAASCWMGRRRTRAQRENEWAHTILKYVSDRSGRRMTLGDICRHLEIEAGQDSQMRILEVLADVPGVDVSVDEMSIVRTT
jgi:hypothetical protein